MVSSMNASCKDHLIFGRRYATDANMRLLVHFLFSEVFALRVWGTMAIVLGKDLHRHPVLNPMLKIVEVWASHTCFLVLRSAPHDSLYMKWPLIIYRLFHF